MTYSLKNHQKSNMPIAGVMSVALSGGPTRQRTDGSMATKRTAIIGALREEADDDNTS